MHTSLVLPAVLAAAASVAGANLPRQATGSGCKDVHVFLARGNNEPYPGRQGKLASAICSGLASCDYEDIQFWNPLESPYCGSVEEGAANGLKQVRAYNARCPDAKLVLSGYSQGAHVLGDILGGGGGVFFQDCRQKTNEGLGRDTPAGQAVVAALIFGDTRHTANQPYNYLDGAGRDGLFPRPGGQLAAMATFSDVTRAYCDKTDPICAQGDVVDNHLNYFDKYTESAAAWVQEMVAKAGGGDEETTTTTAEASATSTSTRAAPSTTTTEEPVPSSSEEPAAPSSATEASSSSEEPVRSWVSSVASEVSETSAAASATTTDAPAATTTVTRPAGGGDEAASTGDEEPSATPSEVPDNGASSLVSGSMAVLAAAAAAVGILAA